MFWNDVFMMRHTKINYAKMNFWLSTIKVGNF